MKIPNVKEIIMENGGKPAKLYIIKYVVMGDKMEGEVRRESACNIPILLYTLYKIFDKQGIYGLEIIPIYTKKQLEELDSSEEKILRSKNNNILDVL